MNGREDLGDDGVIPVTRSTAVGVRSDACSIITKRSEDLGGYGYLLSAVLWQNKRNLSWDCMRFVFCWDVWYFLRVSFVFWWDVASQKQRSGT